MKLILLFIIFSMTSSYVWAQCVPQKQNEAIVMFDMNLSYTEIQGAEEAACKRGQRLIIFPHGNDKHKELGKLNSDANYFLQLTRNNCPGKKCDEIREKHKATVDKLTELRLKLPASPTPEKIFTELAGNDVKIKSLILSGHDGGGSFSGTLGNTGKHKIIEAYKKTYGQKPELKDELKSLYLWGCYTATLSEASSWKNGIPSVDLIAGFHGSGPSIGKDATKDYLKDMLVKEEQVLKEKDANEIKKALNGIKNINQTLAGVYLNACDENEYYMSREKRRTENGEVVERVFGRVDELTCNNARFKEDYEKFQERFLKYYNGELPIPENTSSGELRDIYNFARAKNHCISELYPYSQLHPEKVGLLLFYNGVKENFTEVFKSDIAKASQELESLPRDLEDTLKTGMGFFEWLYESTSMKVSKAMGKGDEIKSLHEEKSKFWLPTAKNLEKASRKDIMENLSRMDAFLSHSAFKMKAMSDKVINLRKVKDQMERYLYLLDHRCMNMLEWHERTTPPPAVYCR